MRGSSWTGFGFTAVFCVVVLSACGDQTPTEPSVSPVSPSSITAPTYAAASGPDGQARVLVQFKTSEGRDFEQRVKALGGTVVRRNKEIGTVLASGLNPAAVAALRARTDVDEVGLDLRAQFIPSRQQLIKSLVRIPASARANPNNQSGAFFFDVFQWNLRKTRANQAWIQTRAGKGARVCVLDTGVDPRHIDLAGKIDIKSSTSFVASEPFIRDLNFHGTYTSSIIAANGLGMGSVAPAARLCAIKVLDETGSGSFADVLAGIVYAGTLGVDVINMSLGALLDFNDPDQRALARALQKAVNFANRQGVLVVASSGNEDLNLDKNPRFRSIPAQLDHVISVGATGPINQRMFDRLASYSNFGRSGNDLVAPGGENITGVTLDEFVLQDLIIGACSEFVPGCEGGDFFAWADGTSASAPHVTGAAAVTESNMPGNQTPDELEHCLLDYADNVGPPVFFGAGRLNVLASATCGPTT